MNDQIRAKLDGIQRIALIVGLLAAVALAVGGFQDHHQFFKSYLFAYFFPLGLAVGSLGLTMINYLTGGFWGHGARRQFQAAIRTLPFLALLFIPIAIAFMTQPAAGHATQETVVGHAHGNFWLYPWTDADLVAGDKLLQHKSVWLNGQFVLGRAIGYFLIWIILGALLLSNAKKFDETGDPKADGRTRTISGPGLLFFFLVTTFAVFDWAMSIEPHWFSTMYGVIAIVGMGVSTLAFSVLFTSWVKGFEPYKTFAKPNFFADVATLMFASVMLWAYTSFSQFLIIWSGNLSEETPWYVVRTSAGWQAIAIGLLVFHFAVPFFLLLMRRIKRDATLVPFVAVLLLFMHLVDVYWQIAPAFHKEGFAPHWMDFVAPIALFGLWLAFFLNRLKAHPLTSPRQETMLAAELGHAHH